MEQIKNLVNRIWKLIWRHKKISVTAIIVLLICIFIFWPRSAKQILTQIVSKGDIIKMVSVTGKIASDKYVDLTFPIGGTLTYLGVKKGDTVIAYQTIATLDQRTVQKNLQIALANYSEQRNSFDATKETNQNSPLNNQIQRILENN